MTEATTPRIVDQVTDTNGQRCQLMRVYKIGDDTVRIRVRHDASNAEESHAVAEVLNRDRKWTMLTSEPVENWHGEAQCPDYADSVETGLHVIADLLYERATAILA